MLLPPCTKAPPQEPNIKFVTGEKDKDGKYHGEIEIHYENGDYFWGDMEHGSKEGMASVVLFNGDNFMGRFKDNYLDGFVQEVITYCDRDNVTREVFYSRGVRHGFYRELGPNKQFWCAGRFCNGEKRGPQWRWGRGGSYNVGNVDIDNKPDGEDNVYLYPDLLTAMEGSYNQGKMKEGHLSVITDISKEYGIPVPVLARLPSDKVYSYEPSSSHVITKRPMLRDPYEQRYVYVKESYVPFAGEGLFAKQKIKLKISEFSGLHGLCFPWKLYICVVVVLDYLPHLPRRLIEASDGSTTKKQEHVSLKNYKATLGHKTCHSFSPNAHFNQFWHPRFGLVMSIVSYRDISPGEEICVSYNYDIPKAPQWYRDLWFHHVRYEMNWSEQKVYSWAARSYKKTGLAVQVPPPERNSSRFIPCGVCDEHVGLDSCSVACQVCEAWHHISCTHIQIQDVMQEGNKYTWTCQKCA